MHPLFRIKPSPRNLISLVADCCTRLANKINAARSTNPLIWTALTLSRPFGTQFVSRVLTQGFKALHILKQLLSDQSRALIHNRAFAHPGKVVP
jgi:hypothetical protein